SLSQYNWCCSDSHLYAAVPLLALAAPGRRRFIPVYAVLTAIATLNLNLFYGISEDIGYAIPRGITGIDMTVLLALANCAALGWHACIFSRECAEPGTQQRTHNQ